MRASKNRSSPVRHGRVWRMHWERWNKKRATMRRTNEASASESRRDLVEERHNIGTQSVDGSQHRDRNTHSNHRVFDGGRAALRTEEQLYKRSRSMGISGRSAGGIGYCAISLG